MIKENVIGPEPFVKKGRYRQVVASQTRPAN